MAGKLKVKVLGSLPPGKHFDGGGLYLDVSAAGGRSWRWKYRRPGDGKETRLTLGAFPDVGLADAREQRDKARAVLRTGTDPGADRRAKRDSANAAEPVNTFKAVAAEWLEKQRAAMSLATYNKAQWQLSYATDLDALPVEAITPPQVLAVLRKLESADILETMHRVKSRIGEVFRYAIAAGYATQDPTGALRGALKPVVSKSHAAIIEPKEVGALLRALHAYEGQPTTMAGLKLAPLLFARPGNLRAMEWRELDLDGKEWRVPAGKMKMKEAHVVPLSKQAVTILRELHRLTGHGRYCFPSLLSAERPMSDNTLNTALRRMGFDHDTMTAHGFRAMASTLLNELGWSPDVIERQLAHAERNKVRATYNRASYMAERRELMQQWADYCDQLRTGGNVTAMKRRRK
ncbi:MAG TPA: integrase arm-type DNA-binding domain-containing protein [Lysobacter sp.]